MLGPSVSIIVPVYNVEPYVEDCIRSVMRQTYSGAMECIVVDDCGTDQSMDVVERLIADYNGSISFKILHHEHNRGLSAARNTGMDAATGDYLFFLDSDDELTDDCIEKLTEPLVEKKWYDVIVGNTKCFRISSLGKKERVKSPQELKIADDMLLYPPNILRTHRIIWGQSAWNKLYRTYFIRNNNLRFKEGLLHEDNLWSFMVACLASSMYCVNCITYIYVNNRLGSITNKETKKEAADSFITIIKAMSLFVENHKINRTETLPFFDNFFYVVLNYYSTSLLSYVSKYILLRPCIKVTLSGILQKNNHQVRGCMHDFHYFLPAYFAPFWQYLIYYRLKSFIKHLKVHYEKKNS